ncbi:hypothetical protein Fmac_028802 [Flemingia macrophylla]|uniref:Zinc finger protein n=1 Tax=Flemingia macrophylla TaxID=520843 RepID=A0ABD1L8Z9_9FABA
MAEEEPIVMAKEEGRVVAEKMHNVMSELEVQVRSSGSKTIECGVCQHPFLVSAH